MGLACFLKLIGHAPDRDRYAFKHGRPLLFGLGAFSLLPPDLLSNVIYLRLLHGPLIHHVV